MLRPLPRSPLFPYTTLFRSPGSPVSPDSSFVLAPAGAGGGRGDLAAAAGAQGGGARRAALEAAEAAERGGVRRSEEHTSELQSPCKLVCRLLLEKKNAATHA